MYLQSCGGWELKTIWLKASSGSSGISGPVTTVSHGGEQHLLILCHFPQETSKTALICSPGWISASGDDWLEEGSKVEELTCSEGDKNIQQAAMTVLDGA